MSRVSLHQRLERLAREANAIDPMAVRVFNLPARERRLYDSWREECDYRRRKLAAEIGEGGIYAALIEGVHLLPQMPWPVREALWPDGEPGTADPKDRRSAADRCAEMLEG